MSLERAVRAKVSRTRYQPCVLHDNIVDVMHHVVNIVDVFLNLKYVIILCNIVLNHFCFLFYPT